MLPRIKPITFLVTALNEEDKISNTVETITEAINHFLCDYEILLVNDGSTDATPQIIEDIARKNPRVSFLHNNKNLGLGGAYKRGVHYVQKEYVMWVSGDNAEGANNLVNIISRIGDADIIIPVLKANKTRPWVRRVTSALFTRMVNFLFGLKLHYYNGAVIHRTELIRSITIHTNSFAYQAEALVRLLKRGCSYVEVPYSSATYDEIFSYAMKPKNLASVFKALIYLFMELRFKKRISRYFLKIKQP